MTLLRAVWNPNPDVYPHFTVRDTFFGSTWLSHHTHGTSIRSGAWTTRSTFTLAKYVPPCFPCMTWHGSSTDTRENSSPNCPTPRGTSLHFPSQANTPRSHAPGTWKDHRDAGCHVFTSERRRAVCDGQWQWAVCVVGTA